MEDPEHTEHFKDAVGYLLNQKDLLMRYLDDPLIPMTNSESERKIRHFSIARKNMLFSITEDGARANAIQWSILETADLAGVDLLIYLYYLFSLIASHQVEIEQGLKRFFIQNSPQHDEYGNKIIDGTYRELPDLQEIPEEQRTFTCEELLSFNGTTKTIDGVKKLHVVPVYGPPQKLFDGPPSLVESMLPGGTAYLTYHDLRDIPPWSDNFQWFLEDFKRRQRAVVLSYAGTFHPGAPPGSSGKPPGSKASKGNQKKIATAS